MLLYMVHVCLKVMHKLACRVWWVVACRWSFSYAAVVLHVQGFVCCVLACLCVSVALSPWPGCSYACGNSSKEKMWLEVHEFSSYIAIVCVEIYMYTLGTRSEGERGHWCTLMHHTHIHMHLCQMYTCAHLHAGTSCSLHRATMWQAQSPFPSRATALNGLKWQPLSPMINVHAAIAGGAATIMATCFLVLEEQPDLVGAVVNYIVLKIVLRKSWATFLDIVTIIINLLACTCASLSCTLQEW